VSANATAESAAFLEEMQALAHIALHDWDLEVADLAPIKVRENAVFRIDLAGGGRAVKPMVAPSQGVHIVVERSFLQSDTALMVPKTSDGRVLFAVPWLGKVILGTTDTPRHDLAREPQPKASEVAFILSESARYLSTAPTRADVKSIWVGLRPLVKPQDDDGESTKALSREHTVLVSDDGSGSKTTEQKRIGTRFPPKHALDQRRQEADDRRSKQRGGSNDHQ